MLKKISPLKKSVIFSEIPSSLNSIRKLTVIIFVGWMHFFMFSKFKFIKLLPAPTLHTHTTTHTRRRTPTTTAPLHLDFNSISVAIYKNLNVPLFLQLKFELCTKRKKITNRTLDCFFN